MEVKLEIWLGTCRRRLFDASSSITGLVPGVRKTFKLLLNCTGPTEFLQKTARPVLSMVDMLQLQGEIETDGQTGLGL